jgi:hypothetical protein
MIILRQKVYSQPVLAKPEYTDNRKSPADANIMTNLGRAGLATSAVIGGVGLQQGGKAVYNLAKAGKEANILAGELKNKPELTKKVIEGASSSGSKFIIKPMASKLGINPEALETVLEQPMKEAAERGVNVAKRG